MNKMEHLTEQLRYGAVVRVSTHKQVTQGDSIEDQRKAIENYVENRGGIISEWFDIIQSATTVEEDQPFQKVISYCKNNPGKLDCIVFMRIDRFTRGGINVYDNLRKELAKYKVFIVDTEGIIGNKEVNTLSHLGLNFDYKWAIVNPTRENEVREAENSMLEAQKICRRLIGAEIRYTQNGYWMRRPPYGLSSEEIFTDSGKRKILVKGKSDEYNFLKLMFDLALKGDKSDKDIIKELNDSGYKSREFYKHDRDKKKIIGKIGGGKLTVEQLRSYLGNPIYAGVICEKWTNNKPVKAQFEGIVTIDEFNKINKGRVHISEDANGVLSIYKGLIAEWRLTKLKENPEYPYKQYVLCPVCKSQLLGSGTRGKYGKKHPAYHCARYKHKRFGVKKAVFDETINRFVNSIELSEDFKDKLITEIRSQWILREKEFNAKAINNNSRILEIDMQIEKKLEDFSNTNSSTLKSLLEQQVEKLQSEKLTLTETRNTDERDQLDMEKLLRNTRYYMEHLPELLMGSTDPLVNASFFGLLFETRPTYTDLVNGTPNLSSIFKLNEDYIKSKSSLVTPRRIELRLPG